MWYNVIYVSTFVASEKPNNLSEYINAALSCYEDIYKIDKDQILDFINSHSGVFQIIFKEAFGNVEEDIVNDYEYTPRNPKEKPSEEKVDDTTADNEEKIKKMSAVLKRMTKERSGYKCELDDLNSCRYLTSKESKNNYVDIHHLVPREFSNEFEKSIEIIDNYVALCPYCHRLLHFAVDRERLSALNYLYNKRKSALHTKEIEIDFKELKAFYGIEE